jgi:hypothetical protein
MKCKNKEVFVEGMRYNDNSGKLNIMRFRCIITNDERGKTLSIGDGKTQFAIPFEPIEKFLK